MTTVVKEYYVYCLKYGSLVLYVGKGKGKRLDHVLSGRSHSPLINRFFFSDKNEDITKVEKVYEDLTQRESLNLETKMINKHKPLFNIMGCSIDHFRKESLELFFSSLSKDNDHEVIVDDPTEIKRQLENTKAELERFKSLVSVMQDRIDYTLTDANFWREQCFNR